MLDCKFLWNAYLIFYSELGKIKFIFVHEMEKPLILWLHSVCMTNTNPLYWLLLFKVITQQFRWEFRNWEEERKKEGSAFCFSMQKILWKRVLMMQRESPFTFYKFPVLQPVCGFQSHRWLKSDVGVKKAALTFLLFLVLQFLLWNKTHIVSRAEK